MEEVLDVESMLTPRRPGPIGPVEKVARLPRRQQDKIVEFIEAFVAQQGRRPS
jgi:hypothetical protein